MTATSVHESIALRHASGHVVGKPVTILLRDLAVITTVGVSARERRAPSTLIFDIDLQIERCRAGITDKVSDTIDYAVVAETIRRSLGPQSFRLLERIAESVAALMLTEFNASRTTIKVYKLGIIPDVRAVGVQIDRTRD